MKVIKKIITSILLLLPVLSGRAEDGHHLWLRAKATASVQVVTSEKSPVISIAKKELQSGWQGRDNARVALKITKDPLIKGDGYRLTPKGVDAHTDLGLLYGTFALLRYQHTGEAVPVKVSNPSYERRILDHWDNPDGSVERGYAGRSIFWQGKDSLAVTEKDKLLWREYARANASIGINGAVLNNVNAAPQILSAPYLKRVKKIADVLRPYGIRVYLSVNFASPILLGGLKTADPLGKQVRDWWKNKAEEIYALIPDFGGFLVKANSEGQPGPQKYGRTHADGANMLAEAVKPYGGIVMWRAFVYSANDKDRTKQAYEEFMPLDGQFADNVIIQVKNGPIDFQPREPFSPLFGAMKKTAIMPELQITQEYLGQSVYLVFLSTMWEEFLQSETYQEGNGSTVARCTDGSLFPQDYTAIAGVANIGRDTNWCGHPFAQANWYAFGRLAWNNGLSSAQIADEWIKQTFHQAAPDQKGPPVFSNDWKLHFLQPVKRMMLQSREAAVNFMTPLGLAHLMSANDHYGPGPWWAPKGVRKDWTPPYFHKADSLGIGFDRTKSGSDAVSQYHEPLASIFNNVATCPEMYLLWFHHLPWDYIMPARRDGPVHQGGSVRRSFSAGETLWEALCYHYQSGLDQVRDFQKVWDQEKGYVDTARFYKVQSKLRAQCKSAQLWKDACLLYFQQFSRRPIPYDIERPVHDLSSMIEKDKEKQKRIALKRQKQEKISLKAVAPIPVGVAVGYYPMQYNQRYEHIVTGQFDQITFENALKNSSVVRPDGRLDYTHADTLVQIAKRNGLHIYGHTLCWYQQNSAYLHTLNGDSAAIEQFLKRYIDTTVRRYKNDIRAWDVVNEAIDAKGQLRTAGPKKRGYFYWGKYLGKGYIDRAFRYAHKANPEALLFYNDYNLESNPQKLQAVVTLVNQLKRKGVPINGVGTQMHISIRTPDAGIDSAFKALASTGLLVRISELDIKVNPSKDTGLVLTPKLLKQQAEKMRDVLQSYFKYVPEPQRQDITFWNVGTKDSWITKGKDYKDSPDLYDADYKTKPMYHSVIKFFNDVL